MKRSKLGAVFHQAKQAYRARDYQTAESLTRRILEEAEDSSAAHILLGTICGSTSRNQESIAEFNRAIEIQPENPEAFNNLGVIFRQTGKSRDALYWLTRAIGLGNAKADIYYNLGNVHKALNNFQEAIEAYRKAIELDPSLAAAYNTLGTLYEQTGDFPHASEILNEGLAADDNSPTLRYNLGLALQSEGKLDDAREQYQRALKSRPGWTDGLNNLGIVLQKLDRHDESIQMFQEILKIEPNNATAHNNIATVLAKQGRADEAIAYYKRALSNKPDYVRAAVNLGQIMEGYRNQNESLEEVRALVAAAPDNFELRFQLVHVLVNLQRYAEAEKNLRFILSNDSSSIRAWQELGGVYTRLGKVAEAAECYIKVQKLDPQNVEFRLELARILRELKKYDAAVAEVVRYLETDPDDFRARLLLGELHCLAGHPQEGVDILEMLKADFPENGSVLAALADAYRLLGDRDKAIGTADELISLQGKRADPEDIERLNESLGLYEKAVEAFERDHQDEWQKNLERLGVLTNNGSDESGSESVGRMLEVDDLGDRLEDADTLLDIQDDQEEDALADELSDADPVAELEEAAQDDDEEFSLDDLLSDGDTVDESGEPEYDWPAGKKPDLSLLQSGDDEITDESDEEPEEPQRRSGLLNRAQTDPWRHPGWPDELPNDMNRYPPQWPSAAGQIPVPLGAAGEQPSFPQPDALEPEMAAPAPARERRGLLAQGQASRNPGSSAATQSDEPDTSLGLGPGLESEPQPEPVPAGHAIPQWPSPPPQHWATGQSPEPVGATAGVPFEAFEEPSELEEVDEQPQSSRSEVPQSISNDDLDVEGIPLKDVKAPVTLQTLGGAEMPAEFPDSDSEDVDEFEGIYSRPRPREPIGREREPERERVPADNGPFLFDEPENDRTGQPVADQALAHSSEPEVTGSGEGVVDDEIESVSPEEVQEAGMLDYLVNLAHELPPDRAVNFEHSEFRLRIETLKSRLAGRKGLLKRMQGYRDQIGLSNDDADQRPITPSRIAETFAFLRRLAGNLPNQPVGEILQQRAGGLLERLKAIRESGDT